MTYNQRVRGRTVLRPINEAQVKFNVISRHIYQQVKDSQFRRMACTQPCV